MNFVLDKTVCKYMFLHNLSQWHYSSIPTFTEDWSKTGKVLSVSEKKYIQDWVLISKKAYLEKHEFLLTLYLQGRLSKTQESKISAIFKALEGRFNVVYSRQEANIYKLLSYLKQEAKNPLINKTLDFYSQEQIVRNVYIALSTNSNRQAGGMALDNSVIMQFGDYKLGKTNEPLLDIFFHEVTHYRNARPFLPKNIKFRIPKAFTGYRYEYIEEVIHRALWSYIGLFTKEYFDISAAQIKRRIEFLHSRLKEPNKTILIDSLRVQPLYRRIS